jgi:hypothetical protein
MSASLSGSLPSGDQNGLAALAPALVNKPEQLHVAVITFSTSKLTTDVDSGDVVPTVRIRQFEPFVGSSDVDELRRLLRRAYERRTGKVELPLQLEQELDALLGSADLTGDPEEDR